jgi:hypothetical protein
VSALPALSLVKKHLPPPSPPSPYAAGAKEIIWELALGWGMTEAGLTAFEPVCNYSIVMCAQIYPSCVSVERLAAVSLLAALAWVLDDICFDNASIEGAVAEDFGINNWMLQNLKPFWTRINKIFRLPELPSELCAIELAYWQAGHLIRCYSSSPDWFNYFADSWEDYVMSSLERHEDHSESGQKRILTDMNAYVEMALRISAMDGIVILLEVANDICLPMELRSDPQIQMLVELCKRNGSISNPLFSYYKEIHVEKSPSRNMVQVSTLGLPYEATHWKLGGFLIFDNTTHYFVSFVKLSSEQLPVHCLIQKPN